jgi:hypothetical protein
MIMAALTQGFTLATIDHSGIKSEVPDGEVCPDAD